LVVRVPLPRCDARQSRHLRDPPAHRLRPDRRPFRALRQPHDVGGRRLRDPRDPLLSAVLRECRGAGGDPAEAEARASELRRHAGHPRHQPSPHRSDHRLAVHAHRPHAAQRHDALRAQRVLQQRPAAQRRELRGPRPDPAAGALRLEARQDLRQEGGGATGMALAMLAALLLFAVRTDSPYVFMAGYALIQTGVACVNVLIWAFITDVIDFQEVRTGERNDATIYGMYSWARKLGQPVAGGMTRRAPGAIGFRSGGGRQDESVLEGVYSVATLLPGLILIVGVLALVFWYPLSKKRVEKNAEILEERHAAEDSQDA